MLTEGTNKVFLNTEDIQRNFQIENQHKSVHFLFCTMTSELELSKQESFSLLKSVHVSCVMYLFLLDTLSMSYSTDLFSENLMNLVQLQSS